MAIFNPSPVFAAKNIYDYGAGRHGRQYKPSGSVTVKSGANQTFTITADSGYYISGVVVEITGQHSKRVFAS